MLHQLADAGDSEGVLRHKHNVSAARYATVSGNPTRVTTHDLYDHHSVMRLRSRVQPINSICNNAHGGIEAERKIRAANVVVDCFGNADERKIVVAPDVQCGRERALAAYDYQPFKAEPLPILFDASNRIRTIKRVKT